MPDYPKEQLWKLYKDLPDDLQKATFSEQVGQNIQDVCKNNGIKNDDLIFDITKNIGYVFLGLLAPNEFSDILIKELKIEKKKAEELSSQITRFVFLPLKKSLEALYQTKIKSEGAKLKTKKVEQEQVKRKDTYREVVE